VLPAIPITAVRLGEDVEELVLSVLRSGMIAQGPLVKRLEDEFADLIGVDHVVAVRQGHARRLNEGLRGLPVVRVPETLPDRHHVWHQYTILLGDEARLGRDELVDELTEAGIGCGIYYPRAVFDYDSYRNHPQVVLGDVPVARDEANRCLSLPVHQYLSEGDLDRIVTTLTTLLGEDR
jgi:dTDP-4-amino-4,6-dideoxygalactose transaminase